MFNKPLKSWVNILNLEKILKELIQTQNTSDEKLKILLNSKLENTLFKLADGKRKQVYGNDVYFRGLIEFTNHCKNNCFYCGIRKNNKFLKRYRLTNEEILRCCEKGYKIGLRTFVLQGGEDEFYTDEKICEIISKIKEKFPDCRITLSIGEREKKAMNLFLKQVQEDSFYVTKLPQKNTTKNFTQKKCLLKTENIAF